MGFRLTVSKGKSEGKEFSFTKARVTVGRNHDNDLVLYDLNVSRHHFEIVLVKGRYRLRDSGSQNGTKLNEGPVVEAPLQDGDRIQIGALEFVFSGSDTQPAIAMGEERTDRNELNPPTNVQQRQALEQIQTFAVNVKQLAEMRRTGSADLKPEAAGPLHKKDPANATQKRLPSIKRKPIWMFIAAGVAVGLVVVLVFAFFFERKPQDLSEQTFALTSKVDERRFGAGKVEVNTPRKAQFAWKSIAGRAIVNFTAGGIERANEVLIELNGKPVSAVPLTGEGWGKEVELKLNRKMLVANEENVLAFVAQPQSGEALRWGIRDLSIHEEALPLPSLEKAKNEIKIADDAVVHRRIALGNLALAEEAYKKAILLMEALDPHPPEYQKTEEKLRATSAELQSIMQSRSFDADRAIKANRKAEAEGILRELLLYFPIPDDPRRNEVANRLEALATK